MIIERASKQDYAELMDLMVRCFRTVDPKHHRFEEILPDLYQPTEEHLSRHLVIRENSRIVSSLGIYPMDLKIGDVRLRVAGVGGVCTAPDRRGAGHMTALMNAARAEIGRQGYALSWLSGIRARYARFGWEMAGSETGLSLPKPKRPGGKGEWEVSRLDAAGGSLKRVLAAREHLVTRGDCDEATLRLKFRRLGNEVWEATLQERHAYLVLCRRMRWVCEWGGDPEGVDALLRETTDAEGAWAVRLPPLRDGYTDLFLDCGERTGCRLGNLGVFDLPALLRAYEPYLAEIWPGDRTLRLAVEPGPGEAMDACLSGGRVHPELARADAELKLGLLKMTSLLFGPVRPSVLLDLPPGMRWLDQVLPLPFYVPMLWGV
ncbi:MAG: GNAT family N-acetyltransferase [Verrucomicrobiota bacterium]